MGPGASGSSGKRLEPNCLPGQQEGCWLDKRKQFQVSDVMGHLLKGFLPAGS